MSDPRAAGPPATTRSRWGRSWLAPALIALSLGLLVLVAVLGDSAAVPGLGRQTPYPPWDLGLGAPSWLVTILAVGAHLVGGAAVLVGLGAHRRDPSVAANLARRTRGLLLGGIAAAFAVTLVPPQGSADHLSYLAYGRIAQFGDDPYVVAPSTWRQGSDPIVSAVQPPWQNTPAVYGPIAVQLFRLVAVLGGGSLRLSVLLWSLCCAVAFAAVALMLHAALSGDDHAQYRAAVLWAANPLLIAQLVMGAHLDVVVVAAALAGLLLAVQVPLVSGMLLGAAAAAKAPYAVFELAALVAVWRGVGRDRRWRAIAYGIFGAAVVCGPAYAWAGPHAMEQSRVASGYTSLASPWRGVVNAVEAVTAISIRPFVLALALAVAAVFAWRLWQALGVVREGGTPRRARPVWVPVIGVRAAFAMTAAWVVCAPYALPWYDAMLWVPLALLPLVGGWAWRGRDLASLFTLRLTVLAVAYLPGRVVGMSPTVEQLTLGVRSYVAPVLMLIAAIELWRWAADRDPSAPRAQR